MSTNPNPRACLFVTTLAKPSARFDDVKALARHIDGLRKGRDIYLRRGIVSGVDGEAGQKEMIAVRFSDEAQGDFALGYAIVGEPPLNGSVQYELLGAALTGAIAARGEAA